MSLEAIEKVMETEATNRERKAAAEAEARQIVADAEKGSLALLSNLRAEAAAEGKVLLEQAKARAEARGAEIVQEAEAEADALRKAAAAHLDEAAELIVGRVVKQ